MPRDLLNVRRIESLREKGLYTDGGNLYLNVTVSGTKSWIFRYRSDGKQHDMGLGPYPDITLAMAREKALVQRRLRLEGQDPMLAKRAGRTQARLDAARAMTFEQCAEAYISAHRAGWRSAAHAHQWGASLKNYAYPVFGNLPVAAVDTALVMAALKPIWNTTTETASRVRNRIEAVLGWATTSGYRAGDNPARWTDHLENLLAKPAAAKRAVRQATGASEHHASLPYAQMSQFMAGLREHKGMVHRALEFLILTAARTGEVIGAKWSEVDLGERTWTIPGDRMKNHKEHRVPLSDAALAILRSMQGNGSDFVFAGQNGGPLARQGFVKAMKQYDGLTVHGFRSSFRDWAAETTAYPSELAEIALSHTVGSKVEAAYRRSDLMERRRHMMDAWAQYCDAPAVGGEVVAIRSTAS
jgi:integrase